MVMQAGAAFKLVRRSDGLTAPPGERPAGIGGEERMARRIRAPDPPRRLAFTWQGGGEVSFDLEPAGGCC